MGINSGFKGLNHTKYCNIAQWNANGLQQHREEVKLFLNQNQIDILLISETHFTSNNHFTIPGYDLCYTNHPDGTAHGDTAIIIKNTIGYYVQLQYAEPVIQATSVQVKGLTYLLTYLLHGAESFLRS